MDRKIVSDKDKHKDDTSIAVKLDAERRREIDEVRDRFENFYREEIKFQADMKNSMAIVVEQQKNLKERFESGTATTLRELKTDFQKFLMEWGKKQEQDKSRDQEILSIDKKVDDTRTNLNWLIRSLIISVCSGILLAVILYAFQNFRG